MKTIIISWGSTLKLADKVKQSLAQQTKNDIQVIKPFFKTFTNKESYVRIVEDIDPHNQIILIRSIIGDVNSEYFKTFLVLNALENIGCKNIIAVFPWFSYAPQDKIFLPGEPKSIELIAKLLDTFKLKKIFVLDIHSSASLGYFTTPISNLFPITVLKNALTENLGKLTNEHVLVILDKGSRERSLKFVSKLNIATLQLDKTRDKITGEITYNFPEDIKSVLKDKITVSYDDFTSTGGTIIKSAQLLKQNGAKKCIYCLSHVLTNEALEKITKSNHIDLVITTNSNELDTSYEKVKFVDLTSELTEALLGEL